MELLRQIESGLPCKDFAPAGGYRASLSRHGGGARRQKFRARPGSPWEANREAGACLSWRGRNFVEAFAAINRCELVQARMFQLFPGQWLAPKAEETPAVGMLEHYHLVCGASAGSTLQVGATVVNLRAGDLWQIGECGLPTIIHGGCEGGVHLSLFLARRHFATAPDSPANREKLWEPKNKAGAAA